MTDNNEVADLLEAIAALLEATRRMVTLTERLIERAPDRSLTATEIAHVRSELDAARTGVERLDTMLTLRRQRLRPF